MARHLEDKHRTEHEVAKILALPKGSKHRRVMFGELLKKEDFHHNKTVLEERKGSIVPKHRRSRSHHADLLPCNNCLGFYVRSELWRHQKACQGGSSGLVSTRGNEVQAKARMLLPTAPESKEIYKDVIVYMKTDDIGLTAQRDSLILDYGKRLHEKFGHVVHRRSELASKMRDMSRLLRAAMGLSSSVKQLKDLFDPKHWGLVIEATRKACDFDSSSHEYGKPSRATRIGYGLRYCARMVLGQGQIEEDQRKEEKARKFLSLYSLQWNDRIASVARTSLQKKQLNKPLMLPTTRDIVHLNTYLQKRAKELRDQEDSGYEELTMICLSQVILFNRKRSGEASRILKSSFLKAQKGTAMSKEVSNSLTKLEIQLAKSHTRVETKGKSMKRGGKVAVLLTDEMVGNIRALLKSQTQANVHSEFLFAKPGARVPYYRGHECLRRCALTAGCKDPSLLQSVRLRKQLAVMMQVLQLSENSQDILADFMGHDLLIHRTFYRLPEDTLQMAKVTKVLHAINEGTLGEMKGKYFDVIAFTDRGRY